MKPLIVSGNLFLNEQDPYEPTGISIMVGNKKEPVILAELIEKHFGIKPDCINHPKKKLRVTIEEIE